VTPEWFSHQSWGSTVTFKLSSQWANSEFLGFSFCAVIAYRSFSHNLEVKCTYHFHNEHGDSHDFYDHVYDRYDGTPLCAEHIIVGFDPCLVAKKDNYMFNKYSEVSVKFQLKDITGDLLPSNVCQVVECGVRLLHANEMHRIDFIMQDYSRFHRVGLKAMFQAKRERLQGMRRDDYFGYVFPRSINMTKREGIINMFFPGF
jgi:hypothetical protein